MLYVLQSYDDHEFHGLFEGPVGLDIETIHRNFMSEFDWHKFETIVQQPYTDPTTPLVYGPCSSGSIPPGTPIPVTSSHEYIKYNEQRVKYEAHWRKSRQTKITEYATKYGGTELSEIFLNYIQKEHGLHKIDCTTVDL